MSKTLYIFEGGAPDKMEGYPNDWVINNVDNFMCKKEFKDIVNNLDNDEYALVCSEHQLINIIDNPSILVDDRVLTLRCNNWMETPSILSKLNVLRLPRTKYNYGVSSSDQINLSAVATYLYDSSKYGIICKPVGNSGGRGLIVLPKTDKYSRWQKVTIEEAVKMMEGKRYLIQMLTNPDVEHYAISTVVKDGKLLDYHSIKSANGCKSSPKWYNFEINYDLDVVPKIETLLEDIIKYLDIESGIFEVEVDFSEDKPNIIEINPRYSWTTSMTRYMYPGYFVVNQLTNNECPNFKDHFMGQVIPMKIKETVIPVDSVNFYD